MFSIFAQTSRRPRRPYRATRTRSALRRLAPSLRRAATIVLLTALAVAWVSGITERSVQGDAARNVSMAVNLAHDGAISLAVREPLPVSVSALGIVLIDAALGRAEPSAYLSGERVRLLKYQNVGWLLLLAAGALWVTRRLTASFTLGLVAVLLVGSLFLARGGGQYVDDLDTGLPAAAALLWTSGALAAAFITRRWAQIAAAGFLLGVLTLIEATTLYLVAGLALAWLFTRLWRGAAVFEPAGRAFAEMGVLIAAFGCTILPWTLRDQFELGSSALSPRASGMLLERALYDEMTPREIAGAIYAWAPQRLKPPLAAKLGFTPADLEHGGAPERLTAGESGLPVEPGAQPDVNAGKVLEARALSIIEAHPLKHLALTALFLWRGAAESFPLLALGLLLAVMCRRDDVGAFLLPAFGLVLLYALFTSFLPRYGVPARAEAAIVIVLAAHLIWAHLVPWRAMSAARVQMVGR